MTNAERDQLLISLSQSVNLISENLLAFRKEHKEDINKLNSKIDKVAQDLEETKVYLESKIDKVAQNLEDTKIYLESEIKQVTQSLEDTKGYIENSKAELNKTIKENIQGAVEIIHNAWREHDNHNKMIQKHEIEIQQLKAMLA